MTTSLTRKRLPVRTRLAIRLRCARLLMGDVRRHGRHHGMRWLVPFVAILLLIALAVTTTTTALPVAVYTLF